ncbi:sugar ABC transporter permease [Microbacterium soli]|uniref:carbohydrate ABC transporter permease n=1 Tax=Microbacterium soli TaxID=446075 RepID=UPI0031D5C084
MAGALVGVPTLALFLFIWGPALASVLLSFTKWNGIGPLQAAPCQGTSMTAGLSNGCLHGVQNYVQAATVYPEFWPAVWHNLIWLVVFMGIATPLGMFFALIIDSGVRGSRFYQSALFLPVLLSLALIGIIWEFMYSSNYGLVNAVLDRSSDSDLIDWLGNPKINLWAVLIEASWRQAGYVMVLYLAGLKSVDPALKEAASLDGVNSWQRFWHVTFPTMRPINIVVLIVTVIESLRAFDLVYITNRGHNGLELLSVLITNNIVGEIKRIGFGSAMGVVLLVISLVPITIFLWQTFRTERAGQR